MLIDFIFAVLIIFACLKGFRKGLIVAIFSIIAFIVGLAAALKLSTLVAAWLQNSTNLSVKWLPFISFAAVFIVVVFLVNWGGKLIQKTFETILLGWVNRIGGVILFAVLYTIIFSIFLFYAVKINLLQDAVIQSSVTYAFIKPWGPFVIDGFGSFIPIFKDMFAQLGNFFEKLAK
jgi:membrane protein required for colicin V production